MHFFILKKIMEKRLFIAAGISSKFLILVQKLRI